MTTKLDPAVLAEIRKLLAATNQLMAIKLYRTHTGAGLAEAKAFIDQLLASASSQATPLPELLDAAAAFLMDRASPPAASAADSGADAQWLAALGQAQALRECAYALCDRYRNGELDYDAVLAELQARCPGFGPRSYELARGDGMFATR